MEQLLTVEETAAMLRISPKTIYNRCHRKTKNPFPVKPVRVGRALRFSEKAVEKFVREQYEGS
jgi:excisionase family DNA binding protein